MVAALYYLVDSKKVITLYEVKSGKFFCYREIENFENYLAFCFYFDFFPCIYLTKQHNYFANRKSY